MNPHRRAHRSSTPRRHRSAALVATLGLALLPAIQTVGPSPAHAAVVPSPAVVVAKMTGDDAVTDTTDRWRVEGTDLGIMWDNGSGELLTAFGDTFGDWSGDGGGGTDWRSNVILRSSDTDLTDGIAFDSAPEDRPGHAAELVPSRKVSGDEMTTIPTAGISVGGRQYMAYMSVNRWGGPGEWWTNYARIAYSDDNGETWNSTDGPTWENTPASDHPFQMAAFAEHDGWIYMYGTPNGRSGQIHVSRVRPADILDKDAYVYWTGAAWEPDADTRAVPIMDGHASEMGVVHNAFANKWIALYLQDYDGIVMRTADEATGPWSDPVVVADPADYPQLYGGFMHPVSADGQDIYFAMSEWRTYSVYLMRVTIRPDGTVTHPNLVADPSFERSGTITAPWHLTGNGGIDGDQLQFSGARNAWMRFNSGPVGVHQDVTVTPGTDYLLTAWARTGGATDTGSVGVRTVDGATVIAEETFTDLPGYTRLQVAFNSGDHDAVQVFGGTSTDAGDRWLQLDAFSLVQVGDVPPLQEWSMGLNTVPEPGTTLAADDLVAYTATLANPGPVALTDLVVTDDLTAVVDDAEVVAGSPAASAGTVDYADGRLTWTGDLAAGATVTITYSVRVGADGARGDSTLTNALSARSPGGVLTECAVEGCRSAGFPVADAPPRPFGVAIDADPVSGSSVVGHDPIAYRVTATSRDAGRDLADVTVTLPGADLFDDAFLDVAAVAASSGEAVVRDGDLVWTTSLPAGASATLDLAVHVKPDGARGDGVLRLPVTASAERGELQPCTAAGCDVAVHTIAGSGGGGGAGGGAPGGPAGNPGGDAAGGTARGAGSLAWTGATVGWTVAAAVVLLAAGAATVLVVRRRRPTTED